MDSQMTSFLSASQEEETMEPLDLSVHSNKRHAEEPGTFQERPLCLIKSCECQNGSLHPRLPLLHHEHQISCTAVAASDGYVWRIEDPTKQLQSASEPMIPCHARDLPSREDHLQQHQHHQQQQHHHHQQQYLLLNRPQSCPITTSAAKWSRFHGLPQNPGADSLRESREDPQMPKDTWEQKQESVSAPALPEDKYSKMAPSHLSKSTQQTKLSTELKETDEMEEEEEEEEEDNTDPAKRESPSLSKTPGIPQWAPLSPTSSVNREPENYLNLMHHLLQGCSTVTDTSSMTRNQHDNGSNHGSAGQRDSDHSEVSVREKDNETPMDQDGDDSLSHQANDGVSASKDTASSNGGKDDGMEDEPSENTNNSADDSAAKKSPAAELKATKVTKVNALDYLISKYLVQNVDVPYKPCNRKIRELLNSGETKICFMDLIELQIEKSFTVPG